jgi:hypothetical protein
VDDGFISRRKLIDYCITQATEVVSNANGDFAAMQNKDLTDDQYEALHISYSTHLGMQRAFRMVLQWVETHSEPPVTTAVGGASGAGSGGAMTHAAYGAGSGGQVSATYRGLHAEGQ